MGNVRREPAQRRELHLPRLYLHPSQVLEKYHCAYIAAASDRHETRADLVVLHHRAHRVETGDRVLAPLFQPACQRRRVVLQILFAPLLAQSAEHFLGARIVLADQAVLVDHQHAVLHVLYHQLADFRHAGKIDFTLCYELLRGDQVFRQRVRHPCRGEVADAEQSSLYILRRLPIVEKDLRRVFDQHRDACQRGVKQREAAAADEPGGGQARQQQQA